MKTPIYDFVNEYVNQNNIRMHMPGHKGSGNTEKYDITEISGADSLYEASGIILESEKNASLLFGADTFYSAEGSSLSIRAMIYLLGLYAKSVGKDNVILAARNAHKVFVSAVSLVGTDVEWIRTEGDSYLSLPITASDVEKAILEMKKPPVAVYLTSPDYLGSMLDIKSISEVCKKHRVLLAIDNAHGAYLKFLTPSRHPIDLGADICCDSAHKTLPCLTGAAYLHISKNAPCIFKENAKDSLALFGSTSPSYLILTSLDKANEYLSDGFSRELEALIQRLDAIKRELTDFGYTLYGNEPMKITIKTKPYGYLGYEFSRELESLGIISEFADRDYITLMPSVKTTNSEIIEMLDAFKSIKKRDAINEPPPTVTIPRRILSPREAMLSECEWVSIEDSIGKVLSAITVGCPPAVPIIISGEEVDDAAVSVFKYYGIEKIKIIKQ